MGDIVRIALEGQEERKSMKRHAAAAFTVVLVLLAITLLSGCGHGVTGIYTPVNEPGNTLVLLKDGTYKVTLKSLVFDAPIAQSGTYKVEGDKVRLKGKGLPVWTLTVVGDSLVENEGGTRVVWARKGTATIKYDTRIDKPVVLLTESKAVSPALNPGAPETIVYGNGLIVQKKDPYSYTAGLSNGTNVESILKKLQDQGYFGLKGEYKSEQPVAGGATTTLDVNTTDKTYEVTVEAGAKPAGWDAMVNTVRSAKTPNMQPYNPSKIRLYATEATSVPASAKVEDWPGLGDELKNAAAAGSKGYEVQMESAISIWVGLRAAFKQGNFQEIYWKTNDGKTYSAVYAYPIFPGTTQDSRSSQKNTAKDTITAYVQSQGLNIKDYVLKNTKVSTSDPDWAVYDYQRFEGMGHLVFLIHKTNGTWTVVATGDGQPLNPQAHRAPNDLTFP